jgi:hypothetical protein
MPLKGEFGSLQIFSIGRMPSNYPPLRSLLLAMTRAVTPPPRWLDRPRRSDCPFWAVVPAWVAAPPRRVFGLGFVAQPSNLVVSW